MAAKGKYSSTLSPMEQQYAEAKAAFPDALLLMRVGDFFEIFGQDAIAASSCLNITLTSRDKNKAEAKPMCGVPHHAVDAYIARLLADGYRVALCDQIEDPKEAKGVVKRAITRVYTPGVVLEEDALAQTERRLLGAAVHLQGRWGLAWIDFSTGEIRLHSQEHLEDALRWLSRNDIFEWVTDTEESAQLLATRFGRNRVTAAGRWILPEAELASVFPFHPRPHLHPQLGQPEITRALLVAAGYITHIQLDRRPGLRLPVTDPSFSLDPDTVRNLELFAAGIEQRSSGSLFAVLDHTVTAAGRRQLAEMLRQPLYHADSIKARQEQVRWLSAEQRRETAEASLRRTADVQRIAVRALHQGRVTGADLAGLRDTLELWPTLAVLLATSNHFSELIADVPDLAQLGQELALALVDTPAVNPTKGFVLSDHYDEYLRNYRTLVRDADSVLSEYEARLRAETGLSNLKIRYNRVFGHYIELPNSTASQAPESFVRKQTLANAERFSTDELNRLGEEILSAEDRSMAREQELFNSLIALVAASADAVIRLGRTLAAVDTRQTLARLIQHRGWVLPEIDPDRCDTVISEGCHPALLASLQDRFVANTTQFELNQRFHLLTGPNMGGKSTYLKQTGQLILLAQIGAPVPASSMKLRPVDQIFTRVGAGDDIALGESTFMVEMRQCAHILSNATPLSLVLLDEVGRGTSTFDGLSIAWALVHHMQDKIGCNTIFATHYHELAELADTVSGVAVYGMEVTEWEGDIVFLHRVRPGSTPHSYGIHVAALAGLPEPLLATARQKLTDLEAWAPGAAHTPVAVDPPGSAAAAPPLVEQLSLFPTAEQKLLRRLAAEQPLHLSPLQALEKILEYQQTAMHLLNRD